MFSHRSQDRMVILESNSQPEGMDRLCYGLVGENNPYFTYVGACNEQLMCWCIWMLSVGYDKVEKWLRTTAVEKWVKLVNTFYLGGITSYTTSKASSFTKNRQKSKLTPKMNFSHIYY